MVAVFVTGPPIPGVFFVCFYVVKKTVLLLLIYLKTGLAKMDDAFWGDASEIPKTLKPEGFDGIESFRVCQLVLVRCYSSYDFSPRDESNKDCRNLLQFA